MEKKISDYLHFYIGCQMIYSTLQVDRKKTKYKLSAYNLSEAIEYGDKPILRPLSDMTEEEKVQCDIESNSLTGDHIRDWANRINWMRKRFIDVDGLI